MEQTNATEYAHQHADWKPAPDAAGRLQIREEKKDAVAALRAPAYLTSREKEQPSS